MLPAVPVLVTDTRTIGTEFYDYWVFYDIEPNGTGLYGTGLFQTGPFRTELTQAGLFKTGLFKAGDLHVSKSANKRSSGTPEEHPWRAPWKNNFVPPSESPFVPPSDSPPLRLFRTLREPLKVSFDHLTIVAWQVFGHTLKGLLPSSRR